MRACQYAFLFAVITSVGCSPHRNVSGESQSLTPAQSAVVENDVRAFTSIVAQDVTQDGPTAWRKHFADTPSFFMAVDGHMAFPNSAAATAGIQALPQSIRHVELRWGNDLRVDPLTENLAVVATSFHEVLTSPAGRRVEENGFFTGVAEYRDGRWQFRNAHWSSAIPSPTVP
jgi:hypothetical protein